MTSGLSLPELEDRIAVTRGNIRQLTEQAAGSHGAKDDERIADDRTPSVSSVADDRL